jgi:hypothetical protein
MPALQLQIGHVPLSGSRFGLNSALNFARRGNKRSRRRRLRLESKRRSRRPSLLGDSLALTLCACHSPPQASALVELANRAEMLEQHAAKMEALGIQKSDETVRMGQENIRTNGKLHEVRNGAG